MTQEKAPRMEAGAGKGGPVREASHHTVQPNRHPVDGREARAERNHPRLVALKRDLAETERLIDRVGILREHPELAEQQDTWVSADRRLAALAKRRKVLRAEIADIESRLFAARVSS